MFEKPVVSFESGDGFSIIGADILVDDEDYDGVHIAAENLCGDFAKVTGRHTNAKIPCKSLGAKPKDSIIIIGTIARSSTIKSLVALGEIDTTRIDGKWESWITASIKAPVKGYKNALIIVGSDKRGAIFGTYSLCQQIGVSP